MHIFHKWSKWEQYEQPMTNTFTRGPKVGASWDFNESWQRRKCDICGKVQQEEVKRS